MIRLKRVLMSVSALVFLGSIISFSFPKPQKVLAYLEPSFQPGVCTYAEDGVTEFCFVYVMFVTAGLKEGEVLREGKWYWCIERTTNSNTYGCGAPIDEELGYKCGSATNGKSYTDEDGVEWTCMSNNDRTHYFWITTQEGMPPCNAQNVGRIWAPGDRGKYFICTKQASGYGWVEIPDPFGEDEEDYLQPQTSGLAGTGILTTDLTFISEMPPCTLAGDNYGGMVDLDSAEIAGITGPMYVGPATAAWQVDEGFKYYDGGWGYAGWRSDDGTYGTASDCSGSEEPGTPWGITATISGQNNVGDTVSCSYSGNYSRSHYKDINLSNLNGNCTVAMHNSSANTFNVENDEWKATIGDWVSGQNPFIPVYADLYDFTLGG